jgi:hypothetical protein
MWSGSASARRLLYLLLPALAVVAVAAAVLHPAGRDGPQISFHAPLPSPPAEAYVYRAAPRNITKADAYRVAALLGVTGELEWDGWEWRAVNRTVEFRMSMTGTVIFFTSRTWLGDLMTPEGAPPPETCVSRALALLSALPVKPEGLGVTLAGVVDDNVTIAFRNGTTLRRVMNRHVNFDLWIDGIRAHGPGAKMRVYCGREGRIVGLLAPLWRLERVGRAAVNVDIAGELRRAFRNATRVEVHVVEYVYFIPSLRARDAEIRPAVLVKGFAIYDNIKRPFVLYIHAR